MCGLNEVNVASKVDVHLIYSLFSEFKSIVKKGRARRNNLEDIFQSKIQLDSQDFYKRVMGQYGSRRFGMKAIVETLASDNVKKFYKENKHSALGDAVTLCQLCNSRLLHDRFRNWVICFQSLIGPSNERLERKRSQSLQRYNFPG